MRHYCFISFLFIALLSFLCVPNVSYSALSNEGNIVCGVTTKGDNIMCSTSTHKCLQCVHHSTTKAFRWLHDNVQHEYRCISKEIDNPKNCTYAPNGGAEGDSYKKLLFWRINEEEGTNCIVSNFSQKYSYCYGCEVVETLSQAFVYAGGKAYDVSKKAANVIVVVLTLLWLAVFVLKNVSSFASIEPMKMLQEFMIQMFKIILAFVIINSGIETILRYSLVPLMNAGTDLADAITTTAPTAAEILNQGGE